MSTATYLQPDSTTQTGPTYKGAIDGGFSVHHRVAGAFAPHEQAPPDMTVRLDAGSIPRFLLPPLEVVAQSTGTITAPVSNSRKDIVYVDASTGAVGVATGTPGAAPSDPAVPAGKVAVARITLTSATTVITNSIIEDLRAPQLLGLGTAATKDVGTSANNVVQLDGTGKLPAVDGSQLTGIVLGDQAARDMAAAALALADANGTAGQKGPFYLANPFTADTLAVKTNATYDAVNDWYSNQGGYGADLITGAETYAASASSSGAASNAADGNAGTFWSSGDTTTDEWWRVDFGTGKAISKVEFDFRTDGSSRSGYQIRASNTNNVATATTLFTHSSTLVNSTTYTATFSNSTAYRYWWVYLPTSGSLGQASIFEVRAYENLAPGNMTLRPAAATLATANPSDVMGYFRFDPVDSVTMGADVVGKVSIDGGSTWATGTWTSIGTLGGAAYEVWRLDADVDAQTGSSLIYEITTANNKEVRFKQCAGLVPLY